MVACGVVCAIALGLLAVPASFAGERELEEAPPPSSVEELFAVELEGFTSHRVNAPDSWDGTLLLGPGQEAYTVLGVANGKSESA